MDLFDIFVFNNVKSGINILLQGKQQNTTLSTSHAQNRSCSSFTMARKGTMKWNASHWIIPAEDGKQLEQLLQLVTTYTLRVLNVNLHG